MIGELSDLEMTKVYRKLRSKSRNNPQAKRYISLIGASFEDLHHYLSTIQRYFHHYTDHCVTHSIRIINRIGEFLTERQLGELSCSELYLLISCALVHDIGMVVSESEARSLASDPKFHESYVRFAASIGVSPSDDWLHHGVGRLFVADYVRRRHGKRARIVAESNLLPLNILTGGDAQRKHWIGKICEGHTLSFESVADEHEFPTRLIFDEARVNVRFVAIALRIGDLLDINTQRICPILRHLSQPLYYGSAAHWDQYSDIKLHQPSAGHDIIIDGTCPTQESHRLLKEWLGWLTTEIGNAVTLLNTSDSDAYRLQVGRVLDRVEPARDGNGRRLYEFLEYRFNLDEERVFTRLFGRRLYGRPDVAIRELVQNAVDATRVRVAYETSGEDRSRTLTSPKHSSLYRKVLIQRRKELRLNLLLDLRPDPESPSSTPQHWLTIEDHGVGMSREVIRDYLLRVGRSRWTEDARIKPLGIGTIGEFAGHRGQTDLEFFVE